VSTIANARARFRRLLTAVPFAWHYDPIFRWTAIGAGIALAAFLVRLADPPWQPTQASAPASVPASGPAYGNLAAGAPAAPVVVPKIAPGRSLNGVTLTPAPEDQFGTTSPVKHK